MKSESLVDSILYSCESIKVGVINVLEAFVQARETDGGIGKCR